MLLGQEGYEVDTAGDGLLALDAIAERAPALVLTDLNMPNMNGMELLAANPGAQVGRSRHRRPPHLADVSSAVSAMRAGAEDYLTKPIDFEALRLVVARALSRQDLSAEAEKPASSIARARS